MASLDQENTQENGQESSTTVAPQNPTQAVANAAPSKEISSFNLTDTLKLYYSKLFPINLFYKWLTYGRDPSEGYFVNREFSFTLEGDAYIRFMSFKDNVALKTDLQKHNPIKIDLGAVYDYINDKQNRKPREREFVLDIDMTDFDDTRSCCAEANICPRCWKFMAIAIRLLHQALTEDFGFKHLLWVYSGRRGIHCWVADRVSREMNTAARSAVTSYLDVLTESTGPKRPKIISKIHPSMERASAVLREYVDDMVVNQQQWAESGEWWKKIFSMCNDSELRSRLEDQIPQESDAETRWERFKALADNRLSKKHTFYYDEVLFHLLYPRLDVNVSTGLNHLLKAPFCLHPKTGRVCVPIDPDHADQFDPFAVPTGSMLISELDAYPSDGATSELAAFQKTSLKPYVEHFAAFVKKLLAKAPKRPEYEGLDF